MGPIAIIDLGTNTFHLLIMTVQDGIIEEVFRERKQVYLAEDGIEEIGDNAQERAILALRSFREKIDLYDVKHVKAIATAAFRKASNSSSLRKRIKKITDIDIDVISGDREAALIAKGVSIAVPMQANTSYLIMDIGGGSVEFIVIKNNTITWAKSFPIGVAILHQKFHRIDPISADAIQAMQLYLDQILTELKEVVKGEKILALLGASGSFEVMEHMIMEKEIKAFYSILDVANFKPICKQIVSLNYKERLELELLPDSRANLVVTALLLMNFVIDLCNAPYIYVSKYAMKEGLAKEMLNF